MKKIILISSLFMAPSISMAGMETCVGLLDYLDAKLANAPAKYAKQDVEKMRKSFKQYRKSIVVEFIEPSLQFVTKGDAEQLGKYRQQLKELSAFTAEQYQKKDASNLMSNNYTIALNECTKTTVPSNKQALENLKWSIGKMYDWSLMK